MSNKNVSETIIMRQLITKFGGTSVSSRQNWNHILTITHKHLATHVQPVIVCSALSGASDKLELMAKNALNNEHHATYEALVQGYYALAKDLDVDPVILQDDLEQLQQWLTGIALLKAAPAKTRALILSLGEIMMTRLGHAFLQQQGVNCQWYDVRHALISKPASSEETINFLSAQCDPEPNPGLSTQLATSGADVIITQGFIAATPDGDTVILGRGGSDTSAGLLAAVLQATLCEIWTDVPGIYTGNPHLLPQARLLKQLNYDEAQEIASMGAKVLHPRSLPPVRKANVPMYVKCTHMPDHTGTCITKDTDKQAPPIKSIQVKHDITLISIDTLNMWKQAGFLADIFSTFKEHDFSVDLLSSSESNITLSLDTDAKLRDKSALDALLNDLRQFSRVQRIEACSAVSLVGHRIRTVLPQLGPILEVFHTQHVYLMSLASNDLNLTFVVDKTDADALCKTLHAILIENNPQTFYYSKSWQEETGKAPKIPDPWWHKDRNRLMDIALEHSPCYVYDIKTQCSKAHELKTITAIDRFFYAIKANPHPDILKVFEQMNLGFECVSIHELRHIYQHFPTITNDRLLFTPNFAAKEEYAEALQHGCYITIDSLFPLEAWPELFKDQSILIRIDPGRGSGHHKYVRTAGVTSKFGIPQSSLDRVATIAKKHNIHIIGLHIHSGSGILDHTIWEQSARMLIEEQTRFPEARILNLGGGLGIPEKPGQQPIAFNHLNTALTSIKNDHAELHFWMEPGRFLVAESGVLLAKVTQCKEKQTVRFIGIETGMNSLIRPALYGAYHPIVNLSAWESPNIGVAHIVGPICESGDTLGYDRLFPITQEKDILLVANTGAYGYCMSSSYNLRPPAKEIILAE